jgi:L-lactate dehydrogenase complex protein LldF
MQPSDSRDFRKNATIAMADANLQKALGGMEHTFVASRVRAVARLPEFEALRDAAKAIKDHALANLDFYLERYADNVEAAGGQRQW